MHKVPMTAILLAGGQSSRMGCDKARLPYGQQTILEHLVDLLGSIFEETFVIVNNRGRYKDLSLQRACVFEDLIGNGGPMAGIYTGLSYALHPESVVLTCDMPLVDREMIFYLLDHWTKNYDVLCFKNSLGKWEPFPAVYRRSCRDLMRSLLVRGHGSMRELLEIARVKSLPLRSQQAASLANINYPEDYARILEEQKLCPRV